MDIPDFKGLNHSKIGYFKDVRHKIKELEKLNIQLARRHCRLDAIFKSMNDGMTILDRDLNIVFTNPVQERLFPEILRGRQKCFQIFYHRDTICGNCPALRTLKNREMLRGEHMFKKGELTGRYFEWTTSPIEDAFGNVAEILLVMRDITARKDYELKLMQSNRMASIGFLSTGIAHEINNPLTSIAGFSEGLLKRLKYFEENQNIDQLNSLREYLEIIHSEAYRCKDIIHNLREFNRISSGQRAPIEIDRIIKETIALFRQYAKDNQIKTLFSNYLSAGFNRLLGEESLLRHLFLNLFKSVFQTLPKGGELRITARNEDDQIYILIFDPAGSLSKELPGCKGYPEADAQSIEMGTALDLSISYNIIYQHKGQIASTPESRDKGVFILTFPAMIA